jgi:tetratricopeptide (TPR) repeat protein
MVVSSVILSGVTMLIRMEYFNNHWAGKYDSNLEIGTILLSNGEYYQAMHYLNAAIKDNPAGADAYCAKGLCYIGVGKTKKGLEYMSTANGFGSEAAKEYMQANSPKSL